MAVAVAPIIRTAGDAARLFRARLCRRERETLIVAHLDAERRLIRLSEETVGATGHVVLPVRAIVADALRLDSVGLILAHCHPSGDPEPSPEDIAATRRLSEMGAGLGLSLLDHLIFAGDECRSFRALGLL